MTNKKKTASNCRAADDYTNLTAEFLRLVKNI